MLGNVLSFFGFQSGSYGQGSRRKHIRHGGNGGRVVIGNKAYPVHDWNMSGIAFGAAREAGFYAGGRVRMLVEFSLPHETVWAELEAVIFRVAQSGLAVALFTEMPAASRRQLDRVLDALHAQEFLQSQVA